MKRVMIAGVSSGCGKTTIVCALLQALINRKIKIVSFKCGPDYIDPMFHSKVIGTKSRNIDSIFMDKDTCNYLIDKNSRGYDIAVIEGVMGYFDGLNMTDRASSHEIAEITNTPVILVINCKGAARSVQAVIKGFLEYSTNSGIKGVIFNQLAPSLYSDMKKYCEECGIKALGYFPKVSDASFESRHLGLITAQEVTNIREKLEILAKTAEKTLDIDGIIELAKTAEDVKYDKERFITNKSDLYVNRKKKITIAVASDVAFCFYYQDNLDMLRELGCELIYFSPLEDKGLLCNPDGIILGGGYPELYAEKLSNNVSMKNQLKKLIEGGIPVHAECGGFMYLHDEIEDVNGNSYKMAGVIKGKCRYTNKLQHFGYIELTALKDNSIAAKGEKIMAHEFHRCISSAVQDTFVASKNGNEWECCTVYKNVVAGFPHISYYSNLNFALNFVSSCEKYRRNREL